MKSLKVPMTQFFADIRGYTLSDGFATVPVQPIGGKLIQFALEHLNDLSRDKVLILSGETQEEKILEALKYSLGTQTDLNSFYDMTDKVLRNELSLREPYLQHRDVIEFQFQPMDCLSVGPDLWFLQELNRARKLGLVFSIGGATPPNSLLLSMGTKLVRYAEKHDLISSP